MAPKFLLALTLLLATAMVVRAAGECTAEKCASCVAGSTTECDKCDEGYGFSNKVCTKCTDANCKKCAAQANKCEECNAGYRLDVAVCVRKCTDANCKTCATEANKCDECAATHVLTPAGACQRSGNSASAVAPVAIASTVLTVSLFAVAA